MPTSTELYPHIIMAIGEVSFWWAGVENNVHGIALDLATYLEPSFGEGAPKNVLNLAIMNMDIRQKIATAKALALAMETSHSPGFYERAEQLLSYIDNIARLERNRFIHDTWTVDGDVAVRANISPRVIKPQSRLKELDMIQQRTYKSPGEIHAFADNIRLIYDDLRDLENHVERIVNEKKNPSPKGQPSEPRPPLPQEWRSLTHRDWRAPSTV